MHFLFSFHDIQEQTLREPSLNALSNDTSKAFYQQENTCAMNCRGSWQHRNKQTDIIFGHSAHQQLTRLRSTKIQAAPVSQNDSIVIGGKKSTCLEASTRYQSTTMQSRPLQLTSLPADESASACTTREGSPTIHIFHMKPLHLRDSSEGLCYR